MAQGEGLSSMQTRNLAGLQVNAVGLGTSATFEISSEEEIPARQQVIDNCLTCDATFIDSSPMYGESERVVGMAIQGRREQFQLATKVWCRGRETGIAQIANSFQLFQTDYIDVFQLHNLVDWWTHLPELQRLKGEGKIGLIGISHWVTSAFPEMISIMKTGQIDTIQVPYNLLETTCLELVLPLAEEMGIGVIVMEPLGSGRLVKGLKSEPDLSPLQEYGIETWAQAMLAWVLADARVSVVIPATSKPQRVFENAKAGSSLPLPQEMRDYLAAEANRCL